MIEDSDDLRKAISKHEPDEKVKIEYIRNKKKSSKTVKLGEREDFNDFNIRIFRDRHSAPRGNSHFDSDNMKELHIEMDRLSREIRIDLEDSMEGLERELIKVKEGFKSVHTFI